MVIALQFVKKIITFLLVLCLVISNMGGYAYALTSFVEADYLFPHCEDINPANLRIELSDIIQKTFNREIEIDISSEVNSQWIGLSLNLISNKPPQT